MAGWLCKMKSLAKNWLFFHSLCFFRSTGGQTWNGNCIQQKVIHSLALISCVWMGWSHDGTKLRSKIYKAPWKWTASYLISFNWHHRYTLWQHHLPVWPMVSLTFGTWSRLVSRDSLPSLSLDDNTTNLLRNLVSAVRRPNAMIFCKQWWRSMLKGSVSPTIQELQKTYLKNYLHFS